MAWGSLANNQHVSFTDIQGALFTLKDGQSHVTSDQWVDKDEALAKYYLNPTPLDGYSGDRWPVKQELIGINYFVCSPNTQELTDIGTTSAESIFEIGTTSGVIQIDYDINFAGGTEAGVYIYYEGSLVHSVTGLDITASGTTSFNHTYNSSTKLQVVFGLTIL